MALSLFKIRNENEPARNCKVCAGTEPHPHLTKDHVVVAISCLEHQWWPSDSRLDPVDPESEYRIEGWVVRCAASNPDCEACSALVREYGDSIPGDGPYRDDVVVREGVPTVVHLDVHGEVVA